MSFAKVSSAQTSLLKAHIVGVEVDLSNGLHAFSVVGLPDKAVAESKDRVSAAIKNTGFKSPKKKNQKVVVALAPADIKKEGPSFDLAIALAYLLAAKEIFFNPKGKLFLGELSLDGELRPVPGVLPLVEEARKRGFAEVYVPTENVREAALIGNIDVFAVNTLKEILGHLNTKTIDENKHIQKVILEPVPATDIVPSVYSSSVDFGDIKGQNDAKRGLLIAAAGGHNVALYGPPGTGKTMLAKAFASILPPLSFDEILEVTSIHSVAGLLKEDLVTEPPIRSPHHTSSYVSLVGGGSIPKPGEITLAHRGVLFLDEFPEFDKRVIETLRQPLEDRVVSVTRARGSAKFPAHFILIAAMNPCPCGNHGSKGKECICSPINIQRYERKLSGPIVDRIDMWIEVPPISHALLSDTENDKPESDEIRKQVMNIRHTQGLRFKKHGIDIKTNSEIRGKDVLNLANLTPKAKEVLNFSAQKHDLSARAYHRVVRLARTIADIEKSEPVTDGHILEALQYRPKKKDL
ncbi:MAG TPA: YifB family Mg chelatase-like AAA ATPase [Candidatus Paceibacterota bacterium]